MKNSWSNNAWFEYMEKLKDLNYEGEYNVCFESLPILTSTARLAQMNRFNWFWNLTYAIYLKVNKMK